MTRLNTLMFVLLIPILIACGGGSGGPTAPADLGTFEVESQSTDLVNQSRNVEKVSPTLSRDGLAAEVARLHSEDMKNRGFFSHVDPDGKTLRNRLRAAGLSFRTAGENLAQVQNSADPAGQAHRLLMESETHRDNILSEKYEVIGVGVAKEGNTYWITQVFVEP